MTGYPAACAKFVRLRLIKQNLAPHWIKLRDHALTIPYALALILLHTTEASYQEKDKYLCTSDWICYLLLTPIY
jgi:hypothetical protein